MSAILGAPWSLLRQRGTRNETGITFVDGVCEGERDELNGDEELQRSVRDFYGIGEGDGEDDEITAMGGTEDVIKKVGVELLAWADLREFRSFLYRRKAVPQDNLLTDFYFTAGWQQ